MRTKEPNCICENDPSSVIACPRHGFAALLIQNDKLVRDNANLKSLLNEAVVWIMALVVQSDAISRKSSEEVTRLVAKANAAIVQAEEKE